MIVFRARFLCCRRPTSTFDWGDGEDSDGDTVVVVGGGAAAGEGTTDL